MGNPHFLFAVDFVCKRFQSSSLSDHSNKILLGEVLVSGSRSHLLNSIEPVLFFSDSETLLFMEQIDCRNYDSEWRNLPLR